MGWDRPGKGEKNFRPEFCWYWTPVKKIPKKIAKNLKNLFPALFLAKTETDRPRKGEKNFSPELRSYSTRQENSEKDSKKIQKIKKPHSGKISSQNGMRLVEKGRKKS